MVTRSVEAPARALVGARLVSFESRRAPDLAKLVRRHGGEILYAPALREVPLADERGILDFGSHLFGGSCDALVLLTGVGTTILVGALCTRWPRRAVIQRLARTPLFCRGPKAAAVVRQLGLSPHLVAPEPHSHRELLAALDGRFELRDRRVFVQEYGGMHEELVDGLARRGARAETVEVYRWALPENTRDLRLALESITRDRVDAAIFTSTHQVDNAFDFSARLGLAEALRTALLSSVVVASLGPVTSEALERRGVRADLTPRQPKLGALVDCLVQNAVQLQQSKRRRHV